jgi:Flp pilus assembly protein TadD
MFARHRWLPLLLLPAFALTLHAEPANPKVIERYKQMLLANPVEGVALERLWKNAIETGQTDALLAEYARVETFPGRVVLGLLQRRAGRLDDALATFTAAAKLDPASPLPALALAKLESDRTQPRAAAGWLEKAAALLVKDDPRLSDTLLELGAAWLAAGDAAQASAAWERCVALAPENLELRRRLAGAYADHALPRDALRHLAYLVEHATPADRAAALQQMARLHSALGEPGAALLDLERATAYTAPESWLRGELLGQMIRTAQRLHVEADLEARWKTQVEKNPRDLGAYLQLVEFYERTAQPEAERAWLEKVVALVPKNFDHRLKLARLLAQLDQLVPAMALYDALLAAQSTNADLVFERARLDLQREDPAAARDRIAALLAGKKADEFLRARALDFYREHRLLDLVEAHLRADAATGEEEAVLALANFFFTQRRNPEGQAALAQFVRPSDPPERRAAMQIRAAQLLKGQGEISAALAATQAALALRPGDRETMLLIGDLEAGLLHTEAAREAYTRAYARSANDAERLEADSKLFDSFRSETPIGDSDSPRSRPPGTTRLANFIQGLRDAANVRKDAESWLRVARWQAWSGEATSAITPATMAAELEPKNPAPREFLAKLTATNRDPSAAILWLRKLIELKPEGRDGYLREIAQIELLRGNQRDAVEVFAQIVRANPGNPDALADLAAAQERSTSPEEAATTWRQVLALLPPTRKPEARASLLRVLQRLGRDAEATDLLLRAMDETPDERERFHRFEDLLTHAQRARPQLEALRANFEERRKTHADDYFTTVALGRILKLLGDKAGAFDLFAEAVYAATNPGDALPDLVHEAEELRKLDTAVRLQEQLSRVTAQDRPDALLKLAALYEKTGDLEGAERTWSRAIAKFPRGVEVLRGAVDYHARWGDRTRLAPLLRRLHALDPSDLRLAAELGEAEFLSGQNAGARAAFEVVLKLTKPVLVVEPPGIVEPFAYLTRPATRLLYPSASEPSPWGEGGAFADDGARATFRDFSYPYSSSLGALTPGSSAARYVELPRTARRRMFSSLSAPTLAPSSPDVDARLVALRRLGELARREGGLALTAWTAQWQPLLSTQPTDAMWALYFSGVRDPVLAALAQFTEREPTSTGHRQAFIWLSLESGRSAALSAWLNGPRRASDDFEIFNLAFTEWVANHPETIDPRLLDELFPRGDSVCAWPSALVLAREHRYPEAIALAQKVWATISSQRALIGQEIASWYLVVGDLAGARRILEEATTEGASSLAHISFDSLRELYFIVPEAERPAWLRARLAAADPRTIPGLMARVLLLSLAGDTAAAGEALDALLATHPVGPPGVREFSSEDNNANLRHWAFVKETWNKLRQWDFPELAGRVWLDTFADEGALAWGYYQKVRETATGAQPITIWTVKESAAAELSSARRFDFATRYLRGGLVERRQIIAALLRRGSDDLENFGEILESFQLFPAAAEVYLAAWDRSPQNPQLLRKLLDAARQADDAALGERIRQRFLDRKLNPANDSTPLEFALQLADFLEQRGAAPQAVEVLTRSLERDGQDFRLLQRKAGLLEKLDRAEEAAPLWEMLVKLGQGDVNSRHLLALTLAERGEFADALAVRTLAPGGVDPLVPVLAYRQGARDDALAALDKLAGEQAVYAAMTLAEAMAVAGDAQGARSVLIATAGRVPDPRPQMQLCTKLLVLPGFPPTPALVERLRARLRELVRQQPALADSYYQFFNRYAARLGIAESWAAEAGPAWAGGSGPWAAGVAVLRLQIARGDAPAAHATCERLLANPGVTGSLLADLDRDLGDLGQPELRLLVAEKNARRGWPMPQATIEWIRLLAATGHRAAARQLLEQHRWLIAFPGGAELLGETWLNFGDAENARPFYQQALQDTQLQPSPSVLGGLARVQVATGRLPAARLLLRRAFALPGCREFTALLEYLDASKALPRWRDALAEFALSPLAEYEFAAALFAHFEKAHRLPEALALIQEQPNLIRPVETFATPATPGDPSTADPRPAPVTCARLRALAGATGGFPETAKTLEALAAAHAIDAPAELAALRADQAEKNHASPLADLEQAARLRPVHWEFTHRLVDLQLKTAQRPAARATLTRFLTLSSNIKDREAAFEWWEKVNAKE